MTSLNRFIRNGYFRAAAFVLIIGITLSLLAFRNNRRLEEQLFQSEFAFNSDNRISAIQHEIESNISALNSLRGLAEIPDSFNERNFRKFAERLLESRPSLRAVEWVVKVPGEERARFEQQIARDGAPYPHLTEGLPGSNRVAANRDQYFAVRYLYPRTAANESAIGFDLGYCRECRAVLDAAADHDEPVAMAKFRILEHTGDGYAIGIVLPVYRAPAPGDSGKNRRERLVGYAMALLQVADVLERALLVLHPQGVNVQFYDQSAAPGRRLLYFHKSRLERDSVGPLPESIAAHPPTLSYGRTLTVGRRQWLIVCTPTASSARAAHTWKPWGVAAGILFVTFGGAAYFLLNGHYASRADRLIRDLTDTTQRLHQEIAVRTETERELAAARDQALEASRLKSQFLATISHEIRTPMNGVIGMTEVLLKMNLTPEQRECAETLRHSGDALLVLINDFLDLARIEAGKIAIDLHPLDIRQVVYETVEMLSGEARARNLQLNLDYAETVPYHVLGDAGRVRQVLTNLVGNALKFTKTGTVTIQAQIDPVPRPGIRISVQDTGVGIAPEHLGNLFQKFSQVDNSITRRHAGTGLGLAISKQLVELMGGKIGVTSQPGVGSTFWFALPLASSDVALVPPAESGTTATGSLATVASSLRVLVVEDNLVNQKVAVRLLEKLGVRADVAVDGREAVTRCTAQDYDLILMDCRMPEMDGFQATREIRARTIGRQCIIVAMTAEAMEGSREDCLAAGMDDYLAKPIRLSDLAAVLEKWVPQTTAS